MLFTPHSVGRFRLRHRIVMPPMTRARAGHGEVATALMADYYRQRAGAALIVSESTQISAQGRGHAWTPGLHTDAQIDAWRQVIEAVHGADGCMFAQLWHAGRVSHRSLQPDGAAPVSASELPATHLKVFVDPEERGAGAASGTKIEPSAPRALRIPEIHVIVHQFAQAARNALAAGFDGVELHAGYGYLLEQFLDPDSNRRADGYGGSLRNRMRFLYDTVQSIIAAVGSDRVGVRLSPLRMRAPHHGMLGDYLAVASALDELGVAYLHMADGDGGQTLPFAFKQTLRRRYRGTLIYSGSYTLDRAHEALRNGWSDLIGFGRAFIANPDLPLRLRLGLPLTPSDPTTFYGGDAIGYTDYPSMPVPVIEPSHEPHHGELSDVPAPELP
jgi:N-ethylmaleimide reductase